MATCTKAFSLNVAGDPAAWWKMEEAGDPRIDAVNGISLIRSSGAPVPTRQAGKVNFAEQYQLAGNQSVIYTTFDWPNFGYQAKGFDFYFWVNLVVAPGTSPIFTFCWYDIQDAVGNVLFTFKLIWNLNTRILTGSGPGATVTASHNPAFNSFHLIRFFYSTASGKLGIQIDDGAKTLSALSVPPIAVSPIGTLTLLVSTIAPDFTGIQAKLDEYSFWMFLTPDAIANKVFNGGVGNTWPLPP